MRKVDFSAFVRKLYGVRDEALHAGVPSGEMVLYMGCKEWKDITQSVPKYLMINMIPKENQGEMVLGIPVYTPVDTTYRHVILYGDSYYWNRWAGEFEIPMLPESSNAPSLSIKSSITGREPALSRKNNK